MGGETYSKRPHGGVTWLHVICALPTEMSKMCKMLFTRNMNMETKRACQPRGRSVT